MKTYNKINDIKTYLRKKQYMGDTVGFIPTMGCLHEGHLSMIKRAAKENHIVVLSIFVNPKQFGKNEDFEKYPRDFEKDAKLAEQAGADIIFYPDINEMYPETYKTYVEVPNLSNVLCGISRPDHFKGVTTIVTKLLNIVHPDRAYFGQKDAQQAILIRQMVNDLNMDSEIIICPTVREKDGLAMSSRNVYLSDQERKSAVILHESLQKAQYFVQEEGIRDTETIVSTITKMIRKIQNITIEYVSIVAEDSLKEVMWINGRVLCVLAVKIGNTRLIDNMIIDID